MTLNDALERLQFGGHSANDVSVILAFLSRCESGLSEIETVLGPDLPKCGCSGCEVEMLTALEVARALLK